MEKNGVIKKLWNPRLHSGHNRPQSEQIFVGFLFVLTMAGVEGKDWIAHFES